MGRIDTSQRATESSKLCSLTMARIKLTQSLRNPGFFLAFLVDSAQMLSTTYYDYLREICCFL